MQTTKSKTTAPARAAAKKSSKTSAGNGKSNTSAGASTSDETSMMEEFFTDELKDIYWAEKHLVKALAKLEKAATSSELKKSFADHAGVTKEHISRLEQAFGLLGKKPQAKKCDAMEGLTKEADGIIEDTEKGTMTRDAALIVAAQKVEHYEIATYGGLRQIAKTLGKNDISELLEQTLGEEKEADELLTNIAETKINVEATRE